MGKSQPATLADSTQLRSDRLWVASPPPAMMLSLFEVLEFTTTQPPREARAFLGEMAHIFNAIFGALLKRESAYASVLGALLELAGEKAQPVEPPADEPLDDSWAEPVVFDGCSSKGQARPGQPQPIHIVRNPATNVAPQEARQGAAT